MISLSYAIKLARTKLKSKRTTLLMSIIVSGLLFSVLFACISLFMGAEKSAEAFLHKANNGGYLVEVSPVIPSDAVTFSENLTLDDVQQIKAYQVDFYNTLRNKYKELGISYDKSKEVPALIPAAWKSSSLSDELRVTINNSSPVISSLLERRFEEYAMSATNKLADLKKVASRYGADGFYEIRSSGLPQIPSMHLVGEQGENFGNTEVKSGDMTTYGYFINAIYNSFYQFEDKRLLDRYLLTKNTDNLKGIPVIVSAQELASLFSNKFNIGKEPQDPSAKKQWLEKVQKTFQNYTYQVCYRNSAEQTLLNKIQQDYVARKENQDNKDYVAPLLQYAYPTQSCGDIGIIKDVRSPSEKNADDKKIENDKKLGQYIEPKHKMLTFQVVGVINAQPRDDYTKSVSGYIKGLLTVDNFSASAIIPIQMYEKLPDALKFGNITDTTPTAKLMETDFATHVLSFATINDARSFMLQNTCPQAQLDCNKKFYADPYGSNYLILDQITKLFRTVVGVILPVILILAVIIVGFTIARIMSESRKETAIYRAMGAKRRDIAKIYIVYTAILALRITTLSFMLGIGAAFVLDSTYGSHLSSIAVASFGTITDDLKFSIFDMSSPMLFVVIILIIVTCALASVQPILRNVSHAPAQDIRDE